MRSCLLPLLLSVAIIPRVRAQETAPGDLEPASLYVTAAADGGFTSFLTAVDGAGLGPVLDQGEDFTLLIPSDHAIASLDPQQRQALLLPDHPGALFAVLSHHLVRGRHSVSELRTLGSVRSVSGQLLDIAPAGATISVDGADIIRADIACSNGVMHVIDAVLVPNTKSLLATLKAEGRFRTLIDLIDEADLDDFIEENAPLTLFAPTDEAFEKIDRYLISDLEHSRNRAALIDLLKRHLVPGEHTAADLLAQGPQTSVADALIAVNQTPLSLVVSDPSGTGRATILRADLDGPGGIVHAIDAVVLPPDGLKLTPDGRLYVGVFTNDRLTQTLQSQLGVREGEVLVVTSLTRGGPCERAGVQVSDVIVFVDDLPATIGNISRLKARKGYGGVINFQIIRAGERMTIPVTVGVER